MLPGEIVRLHHGAVSSRCRWCYPVSTCSSSAARVNTLAPEPITAQAPLGTTITGTTMSDDRTVLLSTGGRVELLVRAPQTPGVSMLTTLATNGVVFKPFPEIALANFVVSGNPVSMSLPAALPVPSREFPVIADSELVARKTITFSKNAAATDLLTGNDFWIDGRLYDEMRIDQTVRLNTAEEWTLLNTSDDTHPFHMHVNSVQVISVNGVPYASPRHMDTV